MIQNNDDSSGKTCQHVSHQPSRDEELEFFFSFVVALSCLGFLRCEETYTKRRLRVEECGKFAKESIPQYRSRLVKIGGKPGKVTISEFLCTERFQRFRSTTHRTQRGQGKGQGVHPQSIHTSSSLILINV